MRRALLCSRLVAATLALLVAMPAGAAEPSTPQGPAAATVYQPPAAYPAPRRIGGALRSGPAALPAIAVLAPDHLGLTGSEQPRLYWFIAEPTRARVEFALVRPGVDPPLAVTILDASSAGIHALDLAALGVRLEPGVEYEWSVAVVTEPGQRSRDIVAGGAILRIAAADPAPVDAAALAQRGLWYDALMALDRSARQPLEERTSREQRAALLEQAGLPEIARFERR